MGKSCWRARLAKGLFSKSSWSQTCSILFIYLFIYLFYKLLGSEISKREPVEYCYKCISFSFQGRAPCHSLPQLHLPSGLIRHQGFKFDFNGLVTEFSISGDDIDFILDQNNLLLATSNSSGSEGDTNNWLDGLWQKAPHACEDVVIALNTNAYCAREEEGKKRKRTVRPEKWANDLSAH